MSGSGIVSVSVLSVHTIRGHTFESFTKALILSKTFTETTVMCVPMTSIPTSYATITKKDRSSESGSSHLPFC